MYKVLQLKGHIIIEIQLKDYDYGRIYADV